MNCLEGNGLMEGQEYDVILLPSAEDDLRNIYIYISNDLQSEINAKRNIARLETEISKLNFMPEGFRLYEYEPWHSKGLRHFPVGNYEIFYIVDKDKKKVFVWNILYGKMNFQEIWK